MGEVPLYAGALPTKTVLFPCAGGQTITALFPPHAGGRNVRFSTAFKQPQHLNNLGILCVQGVFATNDRSLPTCWGLRPMNKRNIQTSSVLSPRAGGLDSGDTTPCKVTLVILDGVVSPERLQ